MRKRMLNYGKGLAQGHTRKDQAGVKQGFLTPHQQLALYPRLFLFASDTWSRRQRNLASWVVPLWVMKRWPCWRIPQSRKERNPKRKRKTKKPWPCIPAAISLPSSSNQEGAPSHSLIVHLSSFCLIGSHRFPWHVFPWILLRQCFSQRLTLNHRGTESQHDAQSSWVSCCNTCEQLLQNLGPNSTSVTAMYKFCHQSTLMRSCKLSKPSFPYL